MSVLIRGVGGAHDARVDIRCNEENESTVASRDNIDKNERIADILGG